MLLAFGIVAALLERERSGEGQVIDAAMLDGAAALFASVIGFMNMGVWSETREANLVDGGAHFYDSYETSDGKYVSIGAIEPQFYAELLTALGLDPADWPQNDRAQWPALTERLREVFLTRTRAEWCELLEGTDVCFAPVLTLSEAAEHPHVAEREVYVNVDGVVQPRRCRGSAAPPARSRDRHARPARTAPRCWRTGASSRSASGSCSRAAPPSRARPHQAWSPASCRRRCARRSLPVSVFGIDST